MPSQTPKTYNLLALIGPTASGKSELAVQLAKRFKGEIISADSRQIYKGMDLGTGKIKGKWKLMTTRRHPERSEGSLRQKVNLKSKIQNLNYVYKGISHHLIDFLNPKSHYSVANFQKQAQKLIKEITERGHLPIICGGTAQWVNAVVYNQIIPEVKPNFKLRAKLEKKSALELFTQLQKLDVVRATTIDQHNKRRLIRALEIIISTSKPVPNSAILNLQPSIYKALWLGIQTNQTELYKKIDKRLTERLKQGMVKEVERLHLHPVSMTTNLKSKILNLKSIRGLSWKKLESFGLEYKYIALFLQKKITKEEMQTQLAYAIKHYSKRQLTWWKRNKNINWIPPKVSVANKLTINFLKNV